MKLCCGTFSPETVPCPVLAWKTIRNIFPLDSFTNVLNDSFLGGSYTERALIHLGRASRAEGRRWVDFSSNAARWSPPFTPLSEALSCRGWQPIAGAVQQRSRSPAQGKLVLPKLSGVFHSRPWEEGRAVTTGWRAMMQWALTRGSIYPQEDRVWKRPGKFIRRSELW